MEKRQQQQRVDDNDGNMTISLRCHHLILIFLLCLARWQNAWKMCTIFTSGVTFDSIEIYLNVTKIRKLKTLHVPLSSEYVCVCVYLCFCILFPRVCVCSCAGYPSYHVNSIYRALWPRFFPAAPFFLGLVEVLCEIFFVGWLAGWVIVVII